MPRLRVIVLDRNATNDFRFVLWADVPPARQAYYANLNGSARSEWSAATDEDNANLRNGVVVEKVAQQRIPAAATINQIRDFMEQRWQTFQTFISNSSPFATWDGTTWTVG